LAFHLREGAYDTDQLIPIVAALGRLLGGDAPVVLVWDNLPVHTSLAMRAWLASQQDWLQAEYLPAYAPDLNPVEGLWDARIDVKWRGAPRSRPGWRGRPRGPGSASSTA
jgi:transposase